MRNSSPINAAAALAVAGSAVLVFLAGHDLPSPPEKAFHAAIGRTMAQETLRLVKPGAGVTAIIRDTAAFRHPESDAQFQAFQETLRAGGSAIVSTQSLQVDPLRNLEVPPGDFFELIRKAPAGTAIVSFMGPPVLSEEQRARLGEIRPRVVAFCPGSIPRRIDLRTLFESGLLHAAVVEREDPAPAGKPPADPKPADWFAANYRVLHGADDVTVTPATPASR